MLASTLATIHNEWFTVSLVDAIRGSIEAGQFAEFQTEFLGQYGSGRRV
jgi:queuine tRNA-ribosyltransferase